VEPGCAGEIVVSGPHVVRGYLHGHGDAETKFRVDGKAWHRTGDLGRLDDRGRLWLLGRASAAIADARGTLFPFAVETAARMTTGGGPVAVLAHEGRRLLVVEESAHAHVPALHAALEWARLDDVVTVRRIPMDRRHNSKVDYAALATRLTSR
jgi:acyl-CoA synthetase (AMP-forming)/AMP-acid ligase II